TGTGLEDGLRGVDVVVDTLNTPSLSRRKAVEFFRTTSHRLLEAGARQGVAHHVVLSIVGIDGIDEPHYAGKLAQERTVQDSEVPHTIARAAQFHEFAAQLSARTTVGPLTIAPRLTTPPRPRTRGRRAPRADRRGRPGWAGPGPRRPRGPRARRHDPPDVRARRDLPARARDALPRRLRARDRLRGVARRPRERPGREDDLHAVARVRSTYTRQLGRVANSIAERRRGRSLPRMTGRSCRSGKRVRATASRS